MPCRQYKSNKTTYKVNLPAFYTLNTISCFILSRDVKPEAGSGSGGSGLNFCGNGSRSTLMKSTESGSEPRKRLILYGAGNGSKKFQRWGSGSERKHKISRGVGSGSIKNLTASTSLILTKVALFLIKLNKIDVQLVPQQIRSNFRLQS